MLSALDHLEHQWWKEKQRSCRMLPDDPRCLVRAVPEQPRRTPVKRAPAEAAGVFRVDRLWRPATYCPGDYAPGDDGTILDRATGLVWQQSGSDYPRPWPRASDYIRHLNETSFAGHSAWRLPTVNELMTLLSPVPQGSALCIEPLFDATQRWVWSADRRSFAAGYYVDVELGFVGWQDFSAPYYIRAVCDTAG
jgi:serine/threonine-protein kinase